MQFSDIPRAVPGLAHGSNDIGDFLKVHGILPSRQTDLSVLVRIKPGQESSPGLGAPRLGNVGVSEKSPLLGQIIKKRGLNRSPVASDLRSIVLGDDEEYVELVVGGI